MQLKTLVEPINRNIQKTAAFILMDAEILWCSHSTFTLYHLFFFFVMIMIISIIMTDYDYYDYYLF